MILDVYLFGLFSMSVFSSLIKQGLAVVVICDANLWTPCTFLAVFRCCILTTGVMSKICHEFED